MPALSPADRPPNDRAVDYIADLGTAVPSDAAILRRAAWGRRDSPVPNDQHYLAMLVPRHRLTASGNGTMGDEVLRHYGRLASGYDNIWTYDKKYIEKFAAKLLRSIDLRASDRIADIGCGTGLYTAQIYQQLKPEHPILCIDPSTEMLGEIPVSDGLWPLQASAEQIASKEIELPIAEPLDAIIIKEAIHHVQNKGSTIGGLADLLAPKGRIVVAMLPTSIDYPLFAAALRKFEELQPDPQDIRDHMTRAGLEARVHPVSFTISLERDRYLKMVRSRYMSLLTCFTDDELTVGIDEIKQKFTNPMLNFEDRFAFVIGRRSSS